MKSTDRSNKVLLNIWAYFIIRPKAGEGKTARLPTKGYMGLNINGVKERLQISPRSKNRVDLIGSNPILPDKDEVDKIAAALQEISMRLLLDRLEGGNGTLEDIARAHRYLETVDRESVELRLFRKD